MRRKILSLSLILAIAWSAFAQQMKPTESAPEMERLRAHVSYLASNKLEGRRTGSTGANTAAEYIAREFSRYGLRRSVGRDLPGMSIVEADSPRRYMQEFPFVAGVELGKNNSMLFTPQASSTATTATSTRAASLDLRLGEDWMPLGFSASGRVENAPFAFFRYGITAPDLNYNDYKGTAANGAVAIIFAGTPDGENPHGQFARYSNLQLKAAAARGAGARALVIIATEDDFKADRLSRLSYENSGGDAGLPVVVVSRQAGARLLGQESPQQLAELEKRLLNRQTDVKRDSALPRPADIIDILGLPTTRVTLSITTDLLRRNAPAYNVVGILEGSDPDLKNEAIVVGAHYDHLGRGGAGSLATREGDIHHGADDNASGVAGVLELARLFSMERARMKRTLVFVAFSGEEEGLLGSNYYVNHPVWPIGQTVAMINMDMIGRMKENRLIIGGVGTAQQWPDWIKAAQAYISAPHSTVYGKGKKIAIADYFPSPFTLTLTEDGYGPSDHSSFYAKQIPVLFFFTGTHDDYHKPSDTAAKINYGEEARILSFVASLLRSIDGSAKRPTYTTAKSQSPGRSTGFRVYLGTIPNYSDSNDGLKLDGVREDSPASKAGLKAGDRITRMAGREVRNVYDYTNALGEMKAGQEYEVELVRGTETLRLKITPAARK